MLVSLLIILLLTVGGACLTYLFAEDETFLWRVCAGNVVASAVFGLLCFLLACFFGFTPVIISLSFLISLLPLLLLVRNSHRAEFYADWQRAKDKLSNVAFKQLFSFGYYAFFFVLFCFFFERAIIEMPGGIFSGASQNYGDLPFHLGAIFSFTDGNNFPPENPSYAFAKFSYPFMADLIAAAFVKLGASVREAMFVQNVTLAFSLLVITERFAYKLTGNRLAGKIAPALLFFSGGLGFLWFIKDYWQGTQSLFDFVWSLPFDYTIRDSDKGEKFRWGNSMVVLFITQRGLLLGMPLTIIVLQKIWEIFKVEKWKRENVKKEDSIRNSHFPTFPLFPFSAFFIGLLAGILPLIHIHSLAVLFVVSAVLVFFSVDKWREWTAFGIGVSIIAVPELIWAMTGSATRLTEFVAWNFGWDKRTDNVIWFWLKNTGAFIPILIFGIYAVYSLSKNKQENTAETAERNTANQTNDSVFTVQHLYFYLPFLLCFIIANLIKLAPWEWDNIKVLIYWFVGSIPFVAFVLARLWEKDKILKIVAAGCLIVLTFAGALDAWRTASRQISFKVFDKDAVAVAEQIKSKTDRQALFLNAPTFNTAIVLAGRRSLMRYGGHLSSYGIDYYEREKEVKRIYAGDAAAAILLKKYDIEYVLISPEEKAGLTVNEGFFQQFPIVAEAGQNREYRVYKVKN